MEWFTWRGGGGGGGGEPHIPARHTPAHPPLLIAVVLGPDQLFTLQEKYGYPKLSGLEKLGINRGSQKLPSITLHNYHKSTYIDQITVVVQSYTGFRALPQLL